MRLPEPEFSTRVCRSRSPNRWRRRRQRPNSTPSRPSTGRLERLRGRLAKSQNALGKSVLGLLGGGDLDEESWEEVEDTLLVADLGPTVTSSVVGHLRSSLAASGVRTEADARRCCARR